MRARLIAKQSKYRLYLVACIRGRTKRVTQLPVVTWPVPANSAIIMQFHSCVPSKKSFQL